MTDPANYSRAIAPAPQSAQVLTDLERTLEKQFEFAKKDDFDAVEALAETTDRLLNLACDTDRQALAPHQQQLRRIRRLHQKLELTLAQKKQDCLLQRRNYAQRKDRLRKGGKAVRAYTQ